MAGSLSFPEFLGPKAALAFETHRLKTLTDSDPPAEIFIVSDLHLGRGRDRYTRRFVCTENFVSDQAFARWLHASHPEEKKLLILNGDTFDFIRIANCPETPDDFANWHTVLARLDVVKTIDELRNSISKKEKRYGLQTDDYKCVWKLFQMALGHQEFLQALACWIDKGGSLLMVKGNHDLDLYWPLVRKAFCLFLEDSGAPALATEQRVFYCDSWVRFNNVYLEHGHKYDPQQEMSKGPVLPDQPTQLNLPLATFVARYLINQLEELEPFLGCLRPNERIMWIVLRKHPVAGIAMLRRSLTFLWRALHLASKRGLFWYGIFIGAVILPFVLFAIFAVLLLVPKVRAWIFNLPPAVSFAVGLLSVLSPYLVAAIRELCNKFVAWREKQRRALQTGEDDLAKGVYENIKGLPFPKASRIYAVMGHTHDPDAQTLPDINGCKVLYLNTGSWIPVWSDDRPDLDGQVRLPFVRFCRDSTGEYHHSYYEWRDDRGHAAEPYILAPSQAD